MSGEMRASMREFWKSYPWTEGTTDEAGNATLTLEKLSLDGSRGSTPSADRDSITGELYLVRIGGIAEDAELPSLLMEPGKVSRGSSYSMKLVRIDSPVYVPTDAVHSEHPERF
jgi:hypothetical protein